MALELDSGATERIGRYIARLGSHLKDRRKRESFAIYAAGSLAEGEHALSSTGSPAAPAVTNLQGRAVEHAPRHFDNEEGADSAAFAESEPPRLYEPNERA